jgi:hypothetical protein
VSHPGEEEVQLLPVERLAAQRTRGLDEDDFAVTVDVRAELVGEEPQRGIAHRASLRLVAPDRAPTPGAR